MENQKKIIWVDFIRALASFLVVLLHSAAPLLTQYSEPSATSWWIGNIYDSAARICVPLFFMLSGYLLLGKEEPASVFFRKRIGKVLVPFFAWSIFFVFWSIYVERTTPASVYAFYSIFFKPAYYHLWFFYAIIGLYLFMPILRIFVQNSGQRLLYYFMVLWVFAVAILPLFAKFAGLPNGYDLNMISGFVGYLVLGYVVGRAGCSLKWLAASVVLAVFSAAVTALGTYYLIRNNQGTLDQFFYGYLSLNVIVNSVSVFYIVKYLFETADTRKITPLFPILGALSAASLGIYVIHPVFLYLFRTGLLGFVLSAINGNPLYTVPLTAISAYLFSFIAIFILQKIPLVRNSVP